MILFDPKKDREDRLRDVCGTVEVSMSDLLRRMMDHCLQETVINQWFPCSSGNWGGAFSENR